MKRLRLGLAAVVALVLAGCGGGGGGSSTPTSGFTYATDWGSGGTARSQVVSVYNSANTLLNRVTFTSTDGTTVKISGIPTGQVRVHADLYDNATASGTVAGSSDVVVQATSSTTVNTVVGGTVNSVAVTPTTSSVLIGQTTHYYATPKMASGQAVFVGSTDIAWSVTGGVGSVTSDGVATGTTVGNGSVVATYVPTSIAGSAAFHVTSNTPTHGKWTVLVFLNAANSLQPYAPLNVDQMEKVASNPDVRFVVQWKQISYDSSSVYPGAAWTGTRRYLVNGNSTYGVNSTLVQEMNSPEVDMGDAQALRAFVQWGMAKYPADHYALVVWDHGAGWRARIASGKPVRGISYDDSTGNNIDVWQLGRAYSDSSGSHSGALQGMHLDIVSFDACLMQMAEVATELKDVCDYVAASEENTPGPGYPYHLIFKNLAANADLDVLNVAKGFTDGMIDYSSYQSLAIQQSVIDTSKISALNTAIDNLSTAVINDSSNTSTLIGSVRNTISSHKFGDFGDGYNFYDLDEVAAQMLAKSSNASVQSAAQSVRDAVANAVVYTRNLKESWSKGIAIDFSTKNQLTGTPYSKLQFAADTHWQQMLLAGP